MPSRPALKQPTIKSQPWKHNTKRKEPQSRHQTKLKLRPMPKLLNLWKVITPLLMSSTNNPKHRRPFKSNLTTMPLESKTQ